MSKVRIIKRTELNGRVRFVIQQKSLWWWADGTARHPLGGWYRCEFETLAQAQRLVCHFNGSKPTEEVVS